MSIRKHTHMEEVLQVLSIRISPETETALRELAKADRRPFSTYVRLALEDHVAKVTAKARR